MMGSDLKQKFLFLYDAAQLSGAKSQLTNRQAQLESCERALVQAQEKEKLIKSVMLGTAGNNICISAALEWQHIKEEILKLNGKSAKLHKEMSNLKEQVRRLESLHVWASDARK